MNQSETALPYGLGKSLIGFLYQLIMLPAIYAALIYWMTRDYFPESAVRLAALVTLPIVVSGAVKWWDIWFRPAPKFGANWLPLRPGEYLAVSLLWDGLVIASCFIAHATVDYLIERDPRVRLTRLEGEIKAVEKELKELWAVEPPTKEARVEHSNRMSANLSRRNQLGLEYETLLSELRSRPDFRHLKSISDSYPEYWAVCYLACLVVVTSLSIPNRAGFHSGQPIVNEG